MEAIIVRPSRAKFRNVVITKKAAALDTHHPPRANLTLENPTPILHGIPTEISAHKGSTIQTQCGFTFHGASLTSVNVANFRQWNETDEFYQNFSEFDQFCQNFIRFRCNFQTSDTGI